MDLLSEIPWLSELESDDCGGLINETIQETCGEAETGLIQKILDLPSASAASSIMIPFGDFNSPKISTLDDNTKNLYYEKPKANIIKTEVISHGQELNFSINQKQQQLVFGNNMEYYGETIKRPVCNRTRLQAQDHVLAERKRREKLSQGFVSLSAMVPSLKKLDKASVLGGAIKYIEQLKEHIKLLEEEKKKRKQEESYDISWIPKKPRFANSSDETSASSGGDQYSDQSSLIDQSSVEPEIEVRISESNVMVRVYCENQSGIIKKILSEIEDLHLGIISNSVIPFGSNKLNITVISQMNSDQIRLGTHDIANTLRTAIQKLI